MSSDRGILRSGYRSHINQLQPRKEDFVMSEAPIWKVEAINQVAIVVKDLDKAMENYWKILGIGPWQVFNFDERIASDLTYDEEDAKFIMKIGLTMVGDTMMELIEPKEGENIYSDFLKEKGEGIHHFGIFVDDVDKIRTDMRAAGLKCLQSGCFADRQGAFAYIDTTKDLSAIWEPLKMSPEGALQPDYVYPES
jgi:hypothetical protein